MVALRGITALFLCLWLPQSLAAVSAQLSAQSIDELETVRLTIKITETRQSETLDLTALEKDFHVLSTNTISQSRFLNGRGVSWVDYQINLQPKRTGLLTIPSVTVGNERTPTLELSVRKLSDQARQAISELVFFENELSNQSIYVQSQVILTRRLLYSQGVQLYSDLPGAPELNDAIVLTLGETRSGTTTRDGKTYGVVEQRYAIFPETSGEYILPGISITASVRLFENNRPTRKGVRVSTDAETITVLPVPAEYPADQPWLPAVNVELHEVITPEEAVHNVGDTLTHELLVHITGNIGSSAPPQSLALDDNDFRVYPAAPVINDDTETDIVRGARLQTQSMLPLRPGLLKIPPTQITWWDTESNQVRVAKSKGMTLSVTGTAIDSQPNDPAPIADTEEITPLSETIDEDSKRDWRELLPYMYAVAGLLIVLLLVVVFKRLGAAFSRIAKRPNSTTETLQKCIQTEDLAGAHHCVQRHIMTYYQTDAVPAQALFAQDYPKGAEALATLSAHLYAAKGSSGELSTCLSTLQDSIVNMPAVKPVYNMDDDLPALYPAR